MSRPTREQIAEVLYRFSGDWQLYGISWRKQAHEGVRTALLDRADAVLALFPQPTPNAEPTVQVPRWFLEDLAAGRTSGRDEARTLLAQQSPPAEPVSIADMAPGTTFTAGLNEDWSSRPHRQWTVRSGGVVWCASEGFGVRTGRIDPSTIRDVAPPAATPGSES